MYIVYTTKLIFNSEHDKNLLLDTLRAERIAFNEASILCYGLKRYSIVDLHSLFYKKFRLANPLIKSQVANKAQKSCLSAYRSIKSRKQKIDQPIKKTRLSLRLDKHLYAYKKESLLFRLTTLQERINVSFVKYKKLQNYLDLYEFGDPTIFEKNNSIYISLPFKVDHCNNPEEPKFALGIDVGIRRPVATSNGKIYQDKKFLKHKRELRYLKNRLQIKNTRSAKKHLKKIGHKEAHRNKNFNHHLANKILNSNSKCNVFVVENLDLVKMKKKKNAYSNKNRISQVGFGELIRILQYKAELRGGVVVKVNPAYTSQTDPVTGKREGERRGCRFYSKSGLVYDADCSAAINIAKLAKLPFSCVFTLDGQAVVNQPIVGIISSK